MENTVVPQPDLTTRVRICVQNIPEHLIDGVPYEVVIRTTFNIVSKSPEYSYYEYKTFGKQEHILGVIDALEDYKAQKSSICICKL